MQEHSSETNPASWDEWLQETQAHCLQAAESFELFLVTVDFQTEPQVAQALEALQASLNSLKEASNRLQELPSLKAKPKIQKLLHSRGIQQFFQTSEAWLQGTSPQDFFSHSIPKDSHTEKINTFLKILKKLQRLQRRLMELTASPFSQRVSQTFLQFYQSTIGSSIQWFRQQKRLQAQIGWSVTVGGIGILVGVLSYLFLPHQTKVALAVYSEAAQTPESWQEAQFWQKAPYMLEIRANGESQTETISLHPPQPVVQLRFGIDLRREWVIEFEKLELLGKEGEVVQSFEFSRFTQHEWQFRNMILTGEYQIRDTTISDLQDWLADQSKREWLHTHKNLPQLERISRHAEFLNRLPSLKDQRIQGKSEFNQALERSTSLTQATEQKLVRIFATAPRYRKKLSGKPLIRSPRFSSIVLEGGNPLSTSEISAIRIQLRMDPPY